MSTLNNQVESCENIYNHGIPALKFLIHYHEKPHRPLSIEETREHLKDGNCSKEAFLNLTTPRSKK